MRDQRIDTYHWHIVSEKKWSQFERTCLELIGMSNPNFPSDFLSYEDLINKHWEYSNFKLRIVMSLWRWMSKWKYILESNVDRWSESFYQILFKELNQSILARKWKKRIDWILHFAIVAWFDPWEMVQYLEQHQELFDWVKIPAFTPIAANNSKFQPLWDFCKKKNWPMLIHCSRNIESNLNFNAVIDLAKTHSDLLITASHMWGDNINVFNKLVLPWISEYWNSLENLFLNTAITNIELISLAIKNWIANRLVFSSDVPFHGNEIEHYKRVIQAWYNDEKDIEELLFNNWLRSLGILN